MKEVAILLLGLVAGGCGYLVVTFWMSPLLRYLQIRHDVTSDLIFYPNVIDPSMVNEQLKKRYEIGEEAFRRHASELAACYHRLPWWYKTLLRRREEDPLIASKNLIGLSNCANSKQADPHVQWLKKSLRHSQKLDL